METDYIGRSCLAVRIRLFAALRHSINEALIAFSSLPLDREYKILFLPGEMLLGAQKTVYTPLERKTVAVIIFLGRGFNKI